MKPYDHKKIEKKWQKAWAAKKLYKTKEDPKKPKCYVLDMFPYPSGEGLHVGHPKGYIATDIYSRFKKMNGFNILHPMGWDAFGLPAENFAIKNKIHPKKAMDKNINYFKEQLSHIGFNYDWEREVNTTDPKFYKWTQWIFLQMLKKGLAFESYEPINWCPSCQTGLANEDLEDGKCERCGSVVEKKPMRQWVLRITDYADRLLKDLDKLNWPESIKESQRNWIGRSEGAELIFKIKGCNEQIKVFTTRPDTLFGVTYVVLAPENSLVQKLQNSIENFAEVKQYIEKTKKETEIERTAEGKEKTGVELKGISAINPANGEEVPVWISDYVLAGYGTGAVMAVPAHDDRDFQFAQKYKLPIKQVIAPFFIDKDNLPIDGKKWSPRKNVQAVVVHPTENKVIQLRWKKVPWKTFVVGGVEEDESFEDAVRREVREETGYKNFKNVEKLGWQMESHFYASHKDINRCAYAQFFKVELLNLDKDELSSEESEKHEVVWVPISDMEKNYWPVTEKEEIYSHFINGPHAFTGNGKIINSGKFDGLGSEAAKKEITEFAGGKMTVTYKLKDWVFSRQRYWGEPIPVIHCEKCGVVPVSEKDLPVKLPDVKNYEPSGTGESPLANISKWVNVKCPKCKGKAKRETNTMPQWAGSSWYYLRYEDPKNNKCLVDKKKEKYWSPVDMYVGGAEHATRHLIYARFWHKFLYDIGVVNYEEPFSQLKNQGLIMGEDGRKMSKRFGNVVNPDDVVASVGADTLRVFEMFMGPFEQSSSWSTNSIMGSRRFLDRVWRLKDKVSKEGDEKLTSLLHKTIKKVTEDIEKFGFNTAISSMMILSNEIEKAEKISKQDFEDFIKILAPFAPHITDELWSELGHKKSIHLESWPFFDASKIKEESVNIVVQINGKVRANFEAPVDISEKEVVEKALSLELVKKWTEGKEIRKTIFVKGKLLNIVV